MDRLQAVVQERGLKRNPGKERMCIEVKKWIRALIRKHEKKVSEVKQCFTVWQS